LKIPLSPFKFELLSELLILAAFHKKEWWPGTALPGEALQHADAVVVGEAEKVWGELVEDFRRGKLKRVYQAQELIDMKDFPHSRLMGREELYEGFIKMMDRFFSFSSIFRRLSRSRTRLIMAILLNMGYHKFYRRMLSELQERNPEGKKEQGGFS
jgi:hypothetical protein